MNAAGLSTTAAPSSCAACSQPISSDSSLVWRTIAVSPSDFGGGDAVGGEVVERRAAVDLGLARAEPIQVGPVEDVDVRHGEDSTRLRSLIDAYAAASSAGSGPSHTTGLPIPCRTTNRSSDPRAFLSTDIAASSASQWPGAYVVGSPSGLEHRAMPLDLVLGQPAAQRRELGDEHHPDGDGRAVTPAVALATLDRVPEGVPVVEHLTADAAVARGGRGLA